MVFGKKANLVIVWFGVSELEDLPIPDGLLLKMILDESEIKKDIGKDARVRILYSYEPKITRAIREDDDDLLAHFVIAMLLKVGSPEKLKYRKSSFFVVKDIPVVIVTVDDKR